MIYKIEPKKTVLESNPGLQTNKILSACTDRELKYILYLYDIESPYIKMRFEDRREKAAQVAGFRKEKGGKRWDRNARPVLTGNVPRVEAAIAEFKNIQRAANINYAVLNVLRTQIDRNIRYIENADETKMTPSQMEKMNKLAGNLQDLIQTKINIERLLNVEGVDDEEDSTEVHVELSTLDAVNLEEDEN